jgi:malate permease and related proteins
MLRQGRLTLILDVLGPVFGIVTLGAALARSGFLSADFFNESNRVTYWIGLPALLFLELVTSLHHVTFAATRVLLVLLGATCLVIALSYLVGRLSRVPAALQGTLVQGAFRGNLAFVGLPIVNALPDVPLSGGVSLRALAVLVLAPTMVFYNIAGVVVLVLGQAEARAGRFLRSVKQLALTPPLLATVLGVAYALAGAELPPPLARGFGLLGDLALPLGLLCVGGAIGRFRVQGDWHFGVIAAAVKTCVSPLVGLAVAEACGFERGETQLVLVFMACPTAIVSYAVAVELKGDGHLASSAIALSCLVSAGVLAAIVGWA